jgi:hypothetical protein
MRKPLPLTTICVPFLDRNHVISMHYDISRSTTIAFQVITLPDVAGKAPPHTYRFLLEPPFAVPPYFTKLHANTLPTNWSSRRSSSAHDPAGCFHVNPDEKLFALELSLRNTEEPTTSFTQHTLNVQHAAFLSHIAAHRAACACAPAAAAGPIVVVPWSVWSPGHTHLTTVPNVSLRDLGRHRVCGMHALSEPHLLLDRGILRIADYHLHRVACARAAATVPVGSGDDDPAVAAVGAEEDTAGGEPPRGGGGGGVQAQIPYVEKDIPLPEGLRSRNVRCILGEDVVVLLEVGHHFRRRSMTQHATRLVPADCSDVLVRSGRLSQDGQDILSPHLALRPSFGGEGCHTQIPQTSEVEDSVEGKAHAGYLYTLHCKNTRV